MDNTGKPAYSRGEGIPHFANKAVLRKRLDTLQKHSEDFYIFYDHEGGLYMSAVLNGVTEVMLEGEFGWANQAPYRADVLLKRGKEPLSAIEITHTSEPSGPKLREAARLGIDVYEVEGGAPPFSEHGLSVLKAHIAPQNRAAHRQFTRRVADLYARVADPPTLCDGFIRVVKNWRGSLDQHDAAERIEMEDMLKEFASMRNEIRQQHVLCLRCKKRNEITPDGGFIHSSQMVHRPNGGCGYRYLCKPCSFDIRGGWNGVLPSDAEAWLPHDDCPYCKDAEQYALDRMKRRLTKGPYGYIVDGMTVSREDFLGLLALMNFAAVQGAKYLEAGGVEAWRIKEFRYITRDGIKTIAKAAHSGADDSNDSNTTLRPAGLFGGALPPCPLHLVMGR
jgi:hypothetical protein